MNHEAIYALDPHTAAISDTDGPVDADGNQVTIDLDLVNDWANPDQYKYQRSKEYPPITDYIDGVVKGDQVQIDAYIAACLAVKDKYPKV